MIERRAESFGTLMRYAPLVAHLAVYAVTCLIAALLFYFGYKPLIVLTDYFSGTAIPSSYSSEQNVAFLALLLGAPLLVILGYSWAIRSRIGLPPRVLWFIAGEGQVKLPIWIPVLVFCFFATIGGYDLLRANVMSKIWVWLDYGEWVSARWKLFSTLGYFSFANLYLFIPVAASWMALAMRGRGRARRLMRWGAPAIALAMTFLLFQKKAAITALIIIGGALLLHKMFSDGYRKRLMRLAVGTTLGAATVYFILVVLPVYSETSKTAEQTLAMENANPKNDASKIAASSVNQTNSSLGQDDQLVSRRKSSIGALLGPNRNVHILAYTVLSPMTRTSAPAMYYPIVFPEHHEYFRLDFGQDILGWGRMPDDNRVVWQYMYPKLPGGSVAAPFQFVLYSQVGTVWALVLSFCTGIVLAILWKPVMHEAGDRVWRSLMGAIVLLFSIYLALDSVRGSLLSSYGVIWGWLFIGIAFPLARWASRLVTGDVTK